MFRKSCLKNQGTRKATRLSLSLSLSFSTYIYIYIYDYFPRIFLLRFSRTRLHYREPRRNRIDAAK